MLISFFDLSLATSGLKIFLVIGGWLLVAVAVGALIMGIFQAVTQVQDNSISFIGKVLVLGLVLYFTYEYFGNEILSFAKSVWGDLKNYK